MQSTDLIQMSSPGCVCVCVYVATVLHNFIPCASSCMHHHIQGTEHPIPFAITTSLLPTLTAISSVWKPLHPFSKFQILSLQKYYIDGIINFATLGLAFFIRHSSLEIHTPTIHFFLLLRSVPRCLNQFIQIFTH